MRVLMTIDGAGGVFTHALELIGALHEEDVEVVVVGLGAPLGAEQRQRLQAVAPAAVHETGLTLEWMPEPWADLERARELLLELEASESPDVIHANAFFCGAIPWRAPVLVAAHSCVRSWWRAVHAEPAPAEWERYSALVAAGLDGADAVVAPSRAMAVALGAEYGLASPVRVIHNGSASSGAGAETKRAFALAAGRMWDPAKNLEALCAAARQMGHPVLIAGELGEDVEAGPGLVDPVCAPAGHAYRLGQLSAGKLAALRRDAAVFVAPARYEPFGLSILEAARAGCALVLGDIPSLRELWEGAACFVAPDDVDALAREADRLLDQPDRAVSLGRIARRHAERYNLARMATEYADLYRTRCRESAGARR